MEMETMNFYGDDRYNREGKHSTEFISESEEFKGDTLKDLYRSINARGYVLMKVWGMPVTATYADGSDSPIYFRGY